jgi:hypothetical protein
LFNWPWSNRIPKYCSSGDVWPGWAGTCWNLWIVWGVRRIPWKESRDNVIPLGRHPKCHETTPIGCRLMIHVAFYFPLSHKPFHAYIGFIKIQATTMTHIASLTYEHPFTIALTVLAKGSTQSRWKNNPPTQEKLIN